LSGVTLTLLSADPTETVDVTVSNDTEAMKQKVQTFVNAYNTLMSEIATDLSYDEENEQAGPLLGDSYLSGVRSDLASIVAKQIPGLSDDALLTTLAHIGVTSSTKGLLVIDDSTLSDALSNYYDDVVDIFCESFTTDDSKIFYQTRTEETQGGTYSVNLSYDGSGNITSAQINGIDATIQGTFIVGAEGTSAEGLTLGFTYPGSGSGTVNTTVRLGLGAASQVSSQAVLSTDADTGEISYAQDGLNSAIDAIDSHVAMWEDRLTETESQMRRKFNQLEVILSQMKSQSSYISSVLG
jgi:flagellar hook-associated protein 2